MSGLVGAYHIIYDSYLRDRVEAQASKSHYNEANVLAMHTLVGAYTQEGRQWLDELLVVLSRNVKLMFDYLSSVDGVELARPEGTYMLYLDCSRWCREHGVTIGELEKRGWDVGVAWQDGVMFGMPDSIRMNVALPESRVREAIRRLQEYVF